MLLGAPGATLTTHENAVWGCGDKFHDKLNTLGQKTRAARLSPLALCTAWEQRAWEHLEHGPPVATCFCDTALCASARGSASLVINDQAYPGIYLTGETIGLMALEPLQALVALAMPIYKEQELSTGVMLTPLTKGKDYARDVLAGRKANDVFKDLSRSGGTAVQKTLHSLHLQGKLQFADCTFDIVKKGRGEVVITLLDGSTYDFHEPDSLLDLKPEKIAVVSIEDGGASNSGVCRVFASVEDPENPGECCPASCLNFRTLSLAS